MKAQRFIPYVLSSIMGIGLLGSSVGFAEGTMAPTSGTKAPLASQVVGGAPVVNQAGTSSLTYSGTQQAGSTATLSNSGTQQAGSTATLSNSGTQQAGSTATLSNSGTQQAGSTATLSNSGTQQPGVTTPVTVNPTAGRMIVKDPYYPPKMIKSR